MLTIGAFARLGGVSVKTLRHYAAIGLLVPAQVDPATGYRSYAPEQLFLSLSEAGYSSAANARFTGWSGSP